MGYFRFRRSFKLFPGVRINLSKTGISTSVGVRGATVNLRGEKITTTVGVHGTGISYRGSESLHPGTHAMQAESSPDNENSLSLPPENTHGTGISLLWLDIVLVVVAFAVIVVWIAG